jgi:hypothetical protein
MAQILGVFFQGILGSYLNTQMQAASSETLVWALVWIVAGAITSGLGGALAGILADIIGRFTGLVD